MTRITDKIKQLPDGDKDRFDVMLRETQAFLCAEYFNAVYWTTVHQSTIPTAEVAKLMAKFALDILALKGQSNARLVSERDTLLKAVEDCRDNCEYCRPIAQQALDSVKKTT